MRCGQVRYTAHGNKRQGTRDLLGVLSGEWSERDGGLGGVSTGCHSPRGWAGCLQRRLASSGVQPEQGEAPMLPEMVMEEP